MNTDMENRKKELKIKLNRKMIVDELNKYLTLQLESFLSVEDTLVLQTKLFNKVDAVDNYKVIKKDISENLKELYNIKPFFEEYLMHKSVLFYSKSCDYGAIEILTDDFFSNIDLLVSFTKFKEGYCDILLVDKELKFGLCVERNEYENKMTYWK